MTTIEQMLDDFVAAIGTPNDAHAVREKIIEAFSQRSKDAALWQALSLDEQFALARRIASNVGYVLISEPSIQEAEDRAEASARSIGGSEAVEVGDLPILARFEQILAQWAIDDRTPPILRDDLRRFLSWFSPIRSRLVASPPGGSEAVGVKAVPDDFVLLPREATEAMKKAGAHYGLDGPGVSDSWLEHAARYYRAMLAAAPSPTMEPTNAQ